MVKEKRKRNIDFIVKICLIFLLIYNKQAILLIKFKDKKFNVMKQKNKIKKLNRSWSVRYFLLPISLLIAIFANMFPITYIIIAITVFVSVTAMGNAELKNKMMFNAYMINNRKEWWRFFSHGLIHADWLHLGFNMYALWIFGKSLESAFSYDEIYGAKGPFFFILLYVGGLVMSSLYSYERNKNNVHYNALGASGAVSAVIFSFIILAPTARLGLMFIPIPIPAYLFGLIMLGVEHYLSKRGNTGIAHDAHFWGSVYGAVFTIALKPSLAVDFVHKIMGTY